jgi:transcriptional regulator of acetoin/glycerol metabolism
MLISSDGEELTVDDVPEDIRLDGRAGPHTASGAARSFHDRKAEAERLIVLEALERNAWHITRTARELGLADHASLLKIMRRHGIERP